MRITLAVALVAAAAAAPAAAASPFDGTWKGDLDASKPSTKPHVFAVRDGVYTSDSVPPLTVAADGQFHKVTGHPYYDEVSVKAGPRTLTMTTRKGGKPMATDTRTLSADGDTIHESFTDMSSPNGVPVKGTASDRRVGPAPAGTLPISGSWIEESGGTASDAALTQTIRVGAKLVSITSPTGYAIDAPLDGTPAAIKGDRAGAMASIRMPAPNRIVETDTIGGKVETVTTSVVDAGGRSMTMTFEDKRRGTSSTVVAHKL